MNRFESHIICMYGKKGQAWLDALPQYIENLSLYLGLSDLQEVKSLSYHYILSGFQDKTAIILKLGMDKKSLKQEAMALECFAAYGVVKLLSKDTDFLLLERAIPGISLTSYLPDNEEKSVEIACNVMKKLHQAQQVRDVHNFPSIKDHCIVLDKGWDLPHGYLEKARKLRDRLLDRAGPNILLHGDLHHDNILHNGSNWIVIDPKGIIGSPMNEVWAFVRNIERDIPWIASFFEFKTQDLFDWYFVHMILAVCWNLENKIDPSLFIQLSAKAQPYTSSL